MTLQEVKAYYVNRIETESVKLTKLKKDIFTIGTIRLIIVLGCITICYALWGNTLVVAATITVSIIAFLGLLTQHNRLFKQKSYCELLIKNAENEIRGIDYDFSPFDGASEKADGNHSFSVDLDIFGDHSFFQSLNRSVTVYGKDHLAQSILSPSTKRQDIENKQAAIKELSSNQDLLAHFRAVGQMSKTGSLNMQDLIEAFSQSKALSKTGWRFTPYIVALLNLIAITLCLVDIISVTVFSVYWVILLGVSAAPLKALKNRIGVLDKKLDELQTYSEIFKVIENNEFESNLLKQIQKQVRGTYTASKSIAQLKKSSDNLFQSFTLVGMLLLNPAMMWNVVYNNKIERWVATHATDIERWFDAIGRFDALVSFSVFAYNHPDYIYPEVSDTFTFEAKGLGHPMLRRESCVCNDVTIGQRPFFLVVTGANMAGKSTYLRTVGLNLTLASTGAPVFATSLVFYPFTLVTNLRTSDSLADNESYFFAELKRLKMIIDRLQSGEELFIILDEILKGTNSQDKQKGSLALMKQLVSLKGNGIIATHDLILGELETQFPSAIKNYRFEADIKNDQLSFSYKIREGVAQNMNACFLMKQMGITGL